MYISTHGAMDTTQIVLIVLIAVLFVAFTIMSLTRNKRERQKMQEMTNSLKRGDKIMTTSGVYGTIVDLRKEGDATIVTIETGNAKNKSYISFNAAAIYSIMNDEPKAQPEKKEEAKPQQKPVAKTQEVKEVKPAAPKAEAKEETKNEKKAS